MKTGWILCLSILYVFSASATVLFEDNFENNSGDLNSRRPDSFDAGMSLLAWWKNEALNLVVTNGTLQTTTSIGQQSAWLTLPEFNTGDVIRVSAVVVANGDVNTDWLSIGLLQSKSHTFQRGEPYFTLTRREDDGVDTGLLKVYGGLGDDYSSLTNVNYMEEAQGFSTNLNARNTVGFEYNTESGNLRVWMTSEDGTTMAQYYGSVNYGGVTNQPIPLSELQYVGVTFNSLNSFSNSNPAYIDDLIVERIPQETLYEDGFANSTGSLHNRRPDYFDTDYGTIAWWKNEAFNLEATNGVLQTDTNIGQQSAWLTLPEINAGDVIRASAVFVANGDANTDWMSMGLLQSKNHTYQRGEPYVTLTRRAADPGANMGTLNVYGGLGGANLLSSQNWLKEQNGFTTNLNARNTVSFEYDTASGNLLVWLTSEGGTTVTQYNGSVNYDGVEGQAVPIEELNYFGLTFNSVNSLDNVNPAYVDDLVVRLVPTSIQPDPYDTWADTFGGTNIIGSQTADYDGDGLDNLYEYGIGGNPTNSADRGTEPVFSYENGSFRYIHVRRHSVTNLAYYLETTTNLVHGVWSSTGYSASGTNITGSTFDYVTNTIVDDVNECFIRLVIEH